MYSMLSTPRIVQQQGIMLTKQTKNKKKPRRAKVLKVFEFFLYFFVFFIHYFVLNFTKMSKKFYTTYKQDTCLHTYLRKEILFWVLIVAAIASHSNDRPYDPTTTSSNSNVFKFKKYFVFLVVFLFPFSISFFFFFSRITMTFRKG